MNLSLHLVKCARAPKRRRLRIIFPLAAAFSLAAYLFWPPGHDPDADLRAFLIGYAPTGSVRAGRDPFTARGRVSSRPYKRLDRDAEGEIARARTLFRPEDGWREEPLGRDGYRAALFAFCRAPRGVRLASDAGLRPLWRTRPAWIFVWVDDSPNTGGAHLRLPYRWGTPLTAGRTYARVEEAEFGLRTLFR